MSTGVSGGMVTLIDVNNRARFGAVVEQMHRDRKKVFVDWLEWNIPTRGELEIDQYDTDDAVYLVSLDPETGDHVASIRLIPCSAPTLMAEHFADMVQSPVPRDDSAWEMTRLCASPAVKDKLKAWNARKEITIGAVEFALQRGIEQLIFVTHTSWVPTILSVGWDIELLGRPRQDGNQQISAMRIHVTPATLELLRRNWDVTESVFDSDRSAAAA